MRFRVFYGLLGATVAVTLASFPAGAASTTIQIASVDLAAAVIEVRNFGDSAEPLDQLSFCSHSDSGLTRQYTLPGFSPNDPLAGLDLAAGASIFVHLSNDAPDEPGHFDAVQLGAFAPISLSGYAIELYDFEGSLADFGSADRIRDHLQWSTDGADLGAGVSIRGGLAASAGLWTAPSDWVATAPETERIELTDQTGGTAHGPDDYVVLPEATTALQALVAMGGLAGLARTRSSAGRGCSRASVGA